MEASVATRSKMSMGHKGQKRSALKTDCFGQKKHTVHERIEDGHGTVGDTSVGVDLLEDCKVC